MLDDLKQGFISLISSAAFFVCAGFMTDVLAASRHNILTLIGCAIAGVTLTLGGVFWLIVAGEVLFDVVRQAHVALLLAKKETANVDAA